MVMRRPSDLTTDVGTEPDGLTAAVTRDARVGERVAVVVARVDDCVDARVERRVGRRMHSIVEKLVDVRLRRLQFGVRFLFRFRRLASTIDARCRARGRLGARGRARCRRGGSAGAGAGASGGPRCC